MIDFMKKIQFITQEVVKYAAAHKTNETIL